MVILMQSTIEFIANTNPSKLEDFNKLGNGEQKEINNIKYIKFE